MQDELVQPAPWARIVGPPPPKGFSLFTRALQATCVLLMVCWVFVHLGGLRLSPKDLGDGANDTSQLFNWHPLLISFAFPLLMAEALLSYKAPLLALEDRSQKKALHFLLQTAAAACTALGVTAAFKSHTLKRPAPMPNLYSAHSYLGVAVLVLFAAQYCIGFAAYLLPKFSLANRRALGPLHIFLGKSIFGLGMATMAVGIQEKCTFIQAFQKPSVFASIMRLPAVLQLFLAATALAVLFHHSAPAAAAAKPEVETLEVSPRHRAETEPLYDSHTA